MARFFGQTSFFSVLFSLQIALLHAQEFTSPRAIALGGYVAVSDDAYGLDWNVSAMAFSKTAMQMSFTKQGFEGSSINNLGLLIKFRDRHVFAIRKTPEFQSFVSFNKRSTPEKPEDVTFYDLLSFSVNEQDWAFGYAFKVSPRLSLGAEAKRYKFGASLLGFFSSSRYWSFGFGATYIFNKRFQVGLVSRNSFSNQSKKHRDRIILQFEGEPDVRVIPLDLSALPDLVIAPEWRLDFGVAARPLNNLLFSFDFYSDGGFGAGVEWQPLKGVYLRQGFSRKNDGLFKPEKISAFAPGIGVRYGSARFDITYYQSQGRDSVLASLQAGELEIRPNIGGDRIWLLSALFFVK